MTNPGPLPISTAMPEARTVPSPCTNVCRIDRRSGWCEGCRRTVDEITRWPSASDAERRAILDELPGRVPRKRLGVSW